MAGWLERMRDGDFEGAWRIADEVLARRSGSSSAHLPRHEQWVWSGEPLDGKRVLIRCYHGLGDTIQFIRYAPLVKARAAEVIVWAQPALLPLLETVRGIDRLLPLHDGTPDVEYDVDVEIMELPHVFRTSLSTIPLEIPYLRVAPETAGSAPPRGGSFRAGLVWRSGGWDERRSLPREAVRPLADVPGVELHAIQREIPHDAGYEEWKERAALVLGDARAIRGFDLLISVDSFPAHLAGALGRPVWLMLPVDGDWRWMRGRDDSPWYPTMKLFRQSRAGDWKDVVERVRAELEMLPLPSEGRERIRSCST